MASDQEILRLYDAELARWKTEHPDPDPESTWFTAHDAVCQLVAAFIAQDPRGRDD